MLAQSVVEKPKRRQFQCSDDMFLGKVTSDVCAWSGLSGNLWCQAGLVYRPNQSSLSFKNRLDKFWANEVQHVSTTWPIYLAAVLQDASKSCVAFLLLCTIV